MGIDEAQVREIVNRVVAAARPRHIILFGSAATGEMTRDSDIDLLVIEDDPGDRLAERLRISRAIRGLSHAIDIKVMATERFEETKNIIGGIAYPADKYGRVVYEAG